MGLARMGSYAGNGSGDIFLAFSTANADPNKDGTIGTVSYIGNDDLVSLFGARRGEAGHYARAIPHKELVRLLKRFGRYSRPR